MNNPNQCEYCGKYASKDDGYFAPPMAAGKNVRLCCDAVCADDLLARDKQQLATPAFTRLDEMVAFMLDRQSVSIEDLIIEGYSFDEIGDLVGQAQKIANRKLVQHLHVVPTPPNDPAPLSTRNAARLIANLLPDQREVFATLEAQGMSEAEISASLPEIIAIAADNFAVSLPTLGLPAHRAVA